MTLRLSNSTLLFALLCSCLICAKVTAQAACPRGMTCDDVDVTVTSDPAPEPAIVSAILPEAPLPEAPPATISIAPLTIGEKFTLGAHRAFGPPSFLLPALQAGGVMVWPPQHYPAAWHDGAQGFGRLYGDFFARNTANYAAQYLTAAMDREDPRYFPSHSKNPVKRFLHAVAFTLVDRSDSGHPTPALSNLAGSAAGGFVTMAYEPAGFNDTTHAYQRASINLAVFAGLNLASEFGPDVARMFRFPHVSNTPESSSAVAQEAFPIWWAKATRTPTP